jgi:hypothetical protein
MELDAVDIEEMRGQAQIAEHMAREVALVSQVVYRLHAAGKPAAGGLFSCLQVSRRQPRMPVVCMHDLRPPGLIQPFRQARRDPA